MIYITLWTLLWNDYPSVGDIIHKEGNQNVFILDARGGLFDAQCNMCHYNLMYAQLHTI